MEFIQIGGAWAFLGLAAILALYMLKLFTLPSHTCSISSSWLTGRPWLSSRYSNMPQMLFKWVEYFIDVKANSTSLA